LEQDMLMAFPNRSIVNVVVWGTMVAQYLYFPLAHDAVMIALLGELFLMCAGLVASVLCYHATRQPYRVLRIAGAFIQLLLGLVFVLLCLVFNGPFGVPLFLVELGTAALNGLAFIEQVIGLRGTRQEQSVHYHPDVRRTLKSWPVIVIACTAVLGFGSVNSFWISFTIEAPAGATTTSSYWGNPNLNITAWTANVTPIDSQTLHITPRDISASPADFENGSLAFVQQVTQTGNGSTNYMNYSSGAKSYPNGTVVLSTPLPTTAVSVTVTFKYVQNWPLLRDLGATNATLILNGFSTRFINESDPFLDIQDTFLFQLLDYWNISFYIQVDAFGDYSHVFNYLSVTPLANKTLDWGVQWHHFLGVSFDCEQESYPQPAGNRPGYIPLFPGSAIPVSWGSLKQLWYWENEQNETLYAQARAAYNNVFLHALGLGKSAYIVLNPTDFSEYLDGGENYHSNPAIPFTAFSNVHYAQMSYHDSDPSGQFAIYRDCVEGVRQLGSRGDAPLLGWISRGASYYTPDEAGFQHYVDDCLVAQAAGATEIFHAPLYGIQAQWGDGAVLRLSQALNAAPKKAITIHAVQFTNIVLWGFWKDFNRPLFYSIYACGIALALVVELRSNRARHRRESR
jgi:hypothetical protein